MIGSGSETTVTCASVGSTSIAWRTTTVPRSNGPAIARTADRQPERRALVGPVRDTEPLREERLAPGAGADGRGADLRLDRQVPAAACALGTQRHALQLRDQAGRHLERQAAHVLLADRPG